MSVSKPVPAKDGNRYIPFEDRLGESSVVFFTRDLSEEGLKKIYDRVGGVLKGKIAVKLHTGEAEGPNILPRPWVKELFESRLRDATIIETNTYYEGTRYTTEDHRKTLETNGWTFCPVDITDADGAVTLWFGTGDISKWDASSLTYTDGDNSVQVSGVAADKITLNFGSSEGYDALAAAGAFLESTAESVFETEAMRTQGVLASL